MTDPIVLPTRIDEARDRTSTVLKRLPGGPALLAWMGGEPNFHDAEVVESRLDRPGSTALRLRVQSQTETHGEFALVSFVLVDILDVQIKGFSHRNVIERLTLRWASERPIHGSLVGLGLSVGEVEIESLACFGAFGTIRGTIAGISVEPVSNHKEAT